MSLFERCHRAGLRTLRVSLALAGLIAGSAAAAGPDVEVSGGWVRAMPPGAPVAAGYLNLRNRSNKPIRVVSLSSAAAEKIEMHQMSTQNGQMRMRRLDNIQIGAGQTLHFAPGGLHLMLIGMTRDLRAKDSITVTLVLDDGSHIELSLPVRDG